MRQRCMWIVSVTCAAAVALVIVSAPSRSGATTTIPGFEIMCFYSHTLKDDPIVNPRAPGGASHLHDFAGNAATKAKSTVSSLRRARTNCQNRDDTAGYWAPVLYRNGTVVHPDRLHVYYRWGEVANIKAIKPPPAGLRVVAGDAHATGPQPVDVVGWNCGIRGQALYNHPVSCRRGQKIVLHVFFPNCWDGAHLDSTDHRSHMAYSHFGSCPASHPVAVPRVAEDYGYPIISGQGITLSSGPFFTAHADYWNTWHQAALEQLVRRCINAGKQCGPVRGPVR